eukprot:SAG11_NODE_250_length_11615_cov_25.090917_6_plen_529_part_00
MTSGELRTTRSSGTTVHSLRADGSVLQRCHESSKSRCLAAGAPTVPDPQVDGECYIKPQLPLPNICEGVGDGRSGVATVIHGLDGAFCARECVPKSDISCDNCPEKPACHVKNHTTGKCDWCNPQCEDKKYAKGPNRVCQADQDLVCPCAPPLDDHGQPVLGHQQCVITSCDNRLVTTSDRTPSYGIVSESVRVYRPLCALTCDPSAALIPGRSKCMKSQVCRPVTDAAFSPAGICLYPKSELPETPFISGQNSSKANMTQLPGWNWADYRSNDQPSTSRCPRPKRAFSCVANDRNASDGKHAPPAGFCTYVTNTTTIFRYNVLYDDDPRCRGQCPELPHGWPPPLLPPDCHSPSPSASPGPPAAQYACDEANGICFPSPEGSTTNQSACELACRSPLPPPPPPPPPTPPPPTPTTLATSPCIRFMDTLPVLHSVDVTITQDAANGSIPTAYTWSDYSFGSYSGWVNVFSAGHGTLMLWEDVNGRRTSKLLFTKDIPLTPGPLVVALKVRTEYVTCMPHRSGNATRCA